MPNAPARAALALLAALACVAGARAAFAQVPAAKQAPASVEGRVTDGERGLPGVTVLLLSVSPNAEPRTTARAKTDHEGRYRLAGVPPGRYQLVAAAPAFVPPTPPGHPPGRRVTLEPGEAFEAPDFKLTRGGVITGRVTDAEGNPLVGEQVHLSFAEAPRPGGPEPSGPLPHFTDDRGVYRIYGLPAGKYRVSVGRDAATGGIAGSVGRYYRRTFHPDAAEESKGRVVEVEAGGEATDVDIRLGPPAKTYTASGRFVTSEGQPAPGVSFGYGNFEAVEGRGLTSIHTGAATGARGEFVLHGLTPGRYAVFAASADGRSFSDSYSDPVTFEVSDADVTGLEVRLRRAASVSGVVHIEGVSDRATLARLLRQVMLFAQVDTAPELGPPGYSQVSSGADGAFRIGGLRPGRVHFGLAGSPPGLTLARVELNGVEQRDGLEVGDGAQVTGVRLVLVYGSGVLRGQVVVTNGTLDDEERLVVFARRPASVDPSGSFGKGAEADARGRFVIEGLAAGHYEVRARVFTPRGPRRPSQPVQVTVPESGDVTVTITLDLAAPGN